MIYYEARQNLDAILELPWITPQAALLRIAGIIQSLLWRAAGLFVIVGVADLLWQRHRYKQELRMTKPEVRQETREQQGNPYVKTHIRRLQRAIAQNKQAQNNRARNEHALNDRTSSHGRRPDGSSRQGTRPRAAGS